MTQARSTLTLAAVLAVAVLATVVLATGDAWAIPDEAAAQAAAVEDALPPAAGPSGVKRPCLHRR